MVEAFTISEFPHHTPDCELSTTVIGPQVGDALTIVRLLALSPSEFLQSIVYASENYFFLWNI